MTENAALIQFEVQERIATLTLNRPERLNALGANMREDLLQALNRAAQDDAVRVVLLTGAGRAFCSGGDVKEMADRKDAGAEARRELEIFPIRDRILGALRSCPKPVMAVVNGAAAGAGFNLALGCDLRIASEKATFSQAFIKRGLHPDWGGTYFLSRMVGTARACELIFSGDTIGAPQALAWGLLNRVVPQDQLRTAARDWALQLAEGPPIALALAKRGIYRNLEADLPSALEYESYAQRVTWSTQDSAEGIRAFVEKRPPNFQGK